MRTVYEFANEYRAREVIGEILLLYAGSDLSVEANAEQEYETIDAGRYVKDDVVVETYPEEAKTEEKENENGEKEIVEVSPAKEKLRSTNVRYRLMIRHHCGRSIRMSAPKKSIRISTARYLWITRSHCSGFI